MSEASIESPTKTPTRYEAIETAARQISEAHNASGGYEEFGERVEGLLDDLRAALDMPPDAPTDAAEVKALRVEVARLQAANDSYAKSLLSLGGEVIASRMGW
jgi:hypothetical protein